MEYYNLYDKNGVITDKIIERNDKVEEGYYIKTCCVCIMDNNNNILLQQRSKNKKSNALKWTESAGGHVDKDETSLQAIMRETKEELGIKLDKKDVNYMFSMIGEAYETYNICDFYYAKIDVKTEDIIIQKEEVEQVKFVKIEEFKKDFEENKENYAILDGEFKMHIWCLERLI